MRRVIAFCLFCIIAGIWLGFTLGHLRLSERKSEVPGVLAQPTIKLKPLPGKALVLDGTKLDSLSTPLVVYTPEPSRWKGVGLVAGGKLDAGIAYEAARVKVDKEITVPLTGWHVGRVELPELTGDVVLTPERVGIGGGVALTDYLDLEAGVSKRFDTGEREDYIGLGWHLTAF